MPDDSIPTDLQPRPRDCQFDLDSTLSAIVGIRAHILDDAFTAAMLGGDRTGSGVVIDPAGLVLTIGYLIMEAETIWLTTADGRAIPGHALTYDAETGLGLVQALGRLGLPALEFGDSAALATGGPAILAAAGGRSAAVKTRLVSRQPFVGPWEYLVEEALYTAPHHPNWAGAALIDYDGRLIGIGSLALQQDGEGSDIDARYLNMVVPTDILKPILDSLRRSGQPDHPPRPWLGLYASEEDDAVLVHGLAEGGPAERAGIHEGDRILAVGGKPAGDLRQFWLDIWAIGPAGVAVPLHIRRGTDSFDLVVISVDRTSVLRTPSLQ
jgi:S1-C subfamily serine protease